MITLLLQLLRLLPFLCGGHRQLAIENLALRQQLAVHNWTATRPRLRTTDRLFWLALARVRPADQLPVEQRARRFTIDGLAFVDHPMHMAVEALRPFNPTRGNNG